MKKVVLKTVDLVKFNNFIDSLIPLSESGTIYFKIDSKGIDTDSHNDSGTIIKSLRTDINSVCGEHNLDKVDAPIKLCFYDGKKVKKAFSFLSGNEIKCEITYNELESTGELFAETMTVSSPKVSITLDAADPELFEFANVPEESIAEVKDTSGADCNFRMTANEIIQVQKFFDFDTNDEVEFQVNGEVRVVSDGAFNMAISDDFGGIEGEMKSYKISKDLLSLVDANAYVVYPMLDDCKIIFEAEDKASEIVITLHEEVDL
jgi:hypothetical protein